MSALLLPGSGNLLLKGVSFRLAPGECLGIIGPSGSGKSTLGKIIAGISAPTVGSVLLDGIDVLALRDSGGGRRLGYLPQDIDLFGETVKDIIARLDDADLQKVIEAAKLAGIHETIIRLPQAYDTVVTVAGANLPRGFRQRLGLARAFFGDPRLVVLDEPNSSLDSLGERMLFDAIEQMKAANTTVIIITHRMGILAATDKIAIMQGGAVSAFGESREIFERYLADPKLHRASLSHENFSRSRRHSKGSTVVEIGGAGALRPASRCHLDLHQTFSPPLCPTGDGPVWKLHSLTSRFGRSHGGCDRRRRRSATGFAASPGQEICWSAASSLVSESGQPMPHSRAPRSLRHRRIRVEPQDNSAP